MRQVAALLIATLAACGGKPAAESTPAPGVTVALLSATDPQLAPIARAAARTFRPGSDGKINFGGLFVNGRELIPLGDSIAREIGATPTGGNRRVPFTICRMGSAGCQPSGASIDPFSYTLKSFRADGSYAFVGVEAPSMARPEGAICITLQWTGLTWEVRNTRSIASVDACGR